MIPFDTSVTFTTISESQLKGDEQQIETCTAYLKELWIEVISFHFFKHLLHIPIYKILWQPEPNEQKVKLDPKLIEI